MILQWSGICVCIFLIYCSQANAKTVAGDAVSVADIPNPMVHPELCGRPGVAHSAICDLSKVLSNEDKDVIEGRINGFSSPDNMKESTKSAQFAVAVVQRMKTDSAFETLEVAAARFAKSLHDRWGVGERATNNGVLLFLSVDDRQVFISPGAGVLKQLSKPALDSVIHHMKPHLREGKYGRAVEGALVEMDMLLKGGDPTGGVDSGNGGIRQWLAYGVVILLLGGIWIDYREKQQLQRMRTGQRVLDRLVRDVSASANSAAAEAGTGTDEGGAFFAAQSCPICLEDFEGVGAGVGQQSPADLIISESSERGQELEPLTSGTNANSAVQSFLNADGSKKKPMALRCGHVFCMPCLQEYIKSVQGTAGGVFRCPICRQSLDGVDGGSAGRTAVGGAAESGVGEGRTAAAAAGTWTDPEAPSAEGQGRDDSSHRYGSFGGNDHGHGGGSSTSCGGSSDSSSWYRHGNDRWRTRMFDRRPELLFRLGRLHRLYPDVLTLQSRASMERALEDGRYTEFAAEANARHEAVQKILDDAAKRAAASRKGRGGSSRSGWGGGMSSGGGSGGSW